MIIEYYIIGKMVGGCSVANGEVSSCLQVENRLQPKGVWLVVSRTDITRAAVGYLRVLIKDAPAHIVTTSIGLIQGYRVLKMGIINLYDIGRYIHLTIHLRSRELGGSSCHQKFTVMNRPSVQCTIVTDSNRVGGKVQRAACHGQVVHGAVAIQHWVVGGSYNGDVVSTSWYSIRGPVG